ncbi:hypothetical protein D3C72_132350 [compost metagenome]
MQHTIQQLILKQLDGANGPMCDDCLAKRGPLKQRQDANREGRKLLIKGLISKETGRCAYCGATKLVSWLSHQVPMADSTQNQAMPRLIAPSHADLSSSRETVAALLPDSLPDPRSLNLPTFHPAFDFTWEPILEDGFSAYRFPTKVSKWMRVNHEQPAIYRWVPYRETPGDIGQLYIGETVNLPRRVGNYLNPYPRQQTSWRLNKLFEGFIQEGITISLDVLRFQHFNLGEVNVSESDLDDKLIRRFIEHMLASYYRKSGWTLINA